MQAMALEVYARQAKNTEAECRAGRVRMRAERRSGELLDKMQRDESTKLAGKNPDGSFRTIHAEKSDNSEYARALKENRIREDMRRTKGGRNTPQDGRNRRTP